MNFKSGFISLIGKPNVGKSTLINYLVGDKIAIISEKPQTTRNIIQGIVTFEEAQIVFLDTPGIVRLNETKTLIDRHIIKQALRRLEGADLIVLIVDSSSISEEDKFIIENLRKIKKAVFLAINKIDKIKESELNSLCQDYENLFPFTRIIPISARKGTNISILVGEMIQYLPPHPPYYSSDLITDQPERILVAELIREKIFALARQEIPYSVLVRVNQFEQRRKDLIYIQATLYVEYSSQKGILIGRAGKMIKMIGEMARGEIEGRLGCQIYLELRVSVKKAWRRRKESLKDLGYEL
ncbi:GTPase Era [Candidatus Aerophobetes bacterium]|uniref:GTPase Era n=1 Tax=Aerophobetes bacterium TaxID=2030807 RepID=A0A523UMV7_UNCAE|nr:MAG: GTPase Era [Candidatus Aerophobetes bacterium]